MAYAVNPMRNTGRTPTAPARKMGTWKMAYADFLTALMAFFLLMWLINGYAQSDREALADYFNGETTAAVHTSTTAPDISELARLISADPALKAAGDNVSIVTTPTHIRINLVDTGERPLFETGEGTLTPSGQDLAKAAGRAIAAFDFPVAIEGHTDAFPSAIETYSNWELSADRANAARRALIASGVEDTRLEGITGLADTAPLKPGEPHHAANRRVSIVLDINR